MMTPAETEALKITAKTAEGLLSRLLGPVADVYGQMIAANKQVRLLENQIKNFKKVQKIIQDNEITIKDVNLKVLFPYLNGVALEEDETLQEMWANLFTNYIDASKKLVVTVYPSVLSQLSSDDVEIIKYMIEGKKNLPVGRWLQVDHDFQPESIANLERLGIIAEVPNLSQYDSGPGHPAIEQLAPEEYFLTDFGSHFYNSCKR